MDKTPTGCTALDTILGGGFEPGILTLIYGEPGTGKTNICLQTSRTCAVQGKKVVYITSDDVSRERLEQIYGEGSSRLLENILFFSPTSLMDQEKIVNKSLKITCGLVVVDTINRFYRLQIHEDESAATRSLTRQLATLQLAAKKKMIPILLTGQVYSAEYGVKPFAGRIVTPFVKTIIQLEKIEYSRFSHTEEREAVLLKHRVHKKGLRGRFVITAHGLE